MIREIRVSKPKFIKKWPLVLEGIANDFTNELVRTCPVDTGNLKNSINMNKVGRNFVITMPYYAVYVEFGTAPHIIRPKNKKALSWTSGKGGGGERFFAKVVHHPGTAPQPFIRTAFDTALKDIIISNLKRQLT